MSVIGQETRSGIEAVQTFEAEKIDLLTFGKDEQSAVMCGQFVLNHEGDLFDISDQEKPDAGKTITLKHDVSDEEVIWQTASVGRGVMFGDRNFTSTITVLDAHGAEGFIKHLDNAGGTPGRIKSDAYWARMEKEGVLESIDFIASLLNSEVFDQQVARKRKAIKGFCEKRQELEAELKDAATPKKLKDMKRMKQQVPKLGFPDTQLYPAFRNS
ncbi:MAG: hypothetical protein U5L95_04865 [Candidatus Saccharibacteria bacterium]|nr:hypothetical protein [Candidatus Saccharibacteria bacterium]